MLFPFFPLSDIMDLYQTSLSPPNMRSYTVYARSVSISERPAPTTIALRSPFPRVGGNRSKERDRKSELVLGSTYQIFEWDRNNSDRNFDFWETSICRR